MCRAFNVEEQVGLLGQHSLSTNLTNLMNNNDGDNNNESFAIKNEKQPIITTSSAKQNFATFSESFTVCRMTLQSIEYEVN